MNKDACMNPEEMITALKFPDYMPQPREENRVKEERKIINDTAKTNEIYLPTTICQDDIGLVKSRS